MDRARRALAKEPWYYLLSLALLVVMLDAYVIGGSTSGVFLVFILITIAWFLLYEFVLMCAVLALGGGRGRGPRSRSLLLRRTCPARAGDRVRRSAGRR